jgi:hypothetical protein
MTEREAMQKAFEIIGVLKPDNFVHRELQGEAWDALRQALAQPEPQVCCGDYEKCIKSCTPRGRWLANQQTTRFEQEKGQFVGGIPEVSQQREWVGLTDDDHKDFANRTKLLPILAKTLAEFIEAKLKEKNT